MDDEPDVLTAWSMMLDMEAMAVTTAPSGRDGLAKARSHLPDIIVCDYMMPGMNGIEFCRAIRADVVFDGVTILLWSAARNIDTKGLVDFVVEKPVRVEEFLRFIRLALRIEG
ncbi:response regulator [Caballeronia sp. LZ035]|uniref:response regulator n=1 Tax=Caballeronia sp. LZ035 TaxID=3038568 RepID=UPI00286752E7|nr:response regulator [Caballeronia sp. LZ035]MDR5755615.1 response regulator [Caballeronia sp. LZ035]